MLTSQNTAQIQHLLDLLRAGDNSAREALLECSLERIHELARRMFHRKHDLRQLSQTDDVLQKALIRLHAALNGVQPADVRTYYGLAARQIRWVLRDLAGEKTAARFVNYTPTPPECEDETAEPRDLEQWSAFHETIEGLDEEDREMFDLLFYEGLTQEEAAEVLQTSIRTVRRRWQRARLRLERALRGDWPPV
jgi:RNA polymerase sigma factor (sigma-70 family)